MDTYKLYVGERRLVAIRGDREAVIVDCRIPLLGDWYAESVKASLAKLVKDKKVVEIVKDIAA